MEEVLRAGIAIYNAGEYHAAHDAWEDTWLDLAEDDPDERLLHGLIQFTAAVYHARNRNWSGARGLADSANDYLADLPDEYRGINIAAVRAYLDRLGQDPELVERQRPLRLTLDGRAIYPDDLEFEAGTIAARVLAEEYEAYELSQIKQAIGYAREELAEGAQTRFLTLVLDFVTDAQHRDLIYQRLTQHVERRERKTEDVEGLFDPE